MVSFADDLSDYPRPRPSPKRFGCRLTVSCVLKSYRQDGTHDHSNFMLLDTTIQNIIDRELERVICEERIIRANKETSSGRKTQTVTFLHFGKEHRQIVCLATSQARVPTSKPAIPTMHADDVFVLRASGMRVCRTSSVSDTTRMSFSSINERM